MQIIAGQGYLLTIFEETINIAPGSMFQILVFRRRPFVVPEFCREHFAVPGTDYFQVLIP
jgi:hypothetical protein